jgi:hypothetical protein
MVVPPAGSMTKDLLRWQGALRLQHGGVVHEAVSGGLDRCGVLQSKVAQWVADVDQC